MLLTIQKTVFITFFKSELYLEKEKWNVDTTQIQKIADEALEEYNKVLEQLESEV